MPQTTMCIHTTSASKKGSISILAIKVTLYSNTLVISGKELKKHIIVSILAIPTPSSQNLASFMKCLKEPSQHCL